MQLSSECREIVGNGREKEEEDLECSRLLSRSKVFVVLFQERQAGDAFSSCLYPRTGMDEQA